MTPVVTRDLTPPSPTSIVVESLSSTSKSVFDKHAEIVKCFPKAAVLEQCHSNNPHRHHHPLPLELVPRPNSTLEPFSPTQSALQHSTHYPAETQSIRALTTPHQKSMMGTAGSRAQTLTFAVLSAAELLFSSLQLGAKQTFFRRRGDVLFAAFDNNT